MKPKTIKAWAIVRDGQPICCMWRKYFIFASYMNARGFKYVGCKLARCTVTIDEPKKKRRRK
jgi:hypothetical protein